MLSWVSGTDGAIFIASHRSATLEQFYDNAMGNCARHLDACPASRPGDGGIMYGGIPNACANQGEQNNPDRGCLNASLGPSLKRVHIFGAEKCPMLRSPLIGGENSALLRPIDHFGLAVDLFDNPAHSAPPENMGALGETSLHPQAGDMPRDEALAHYQARFGRSKVDIRNIRGAINNLGVCIAEDATIGAVFGMVRQVSITTSHGERRAYPT